MGKGREENTGIWGQTIGKHSKETRVFAPQPFPKKPDCYRDCPTTLQAPIPQLWAWELNRCGSLLPIAVGSELPRPMR